uniref:Epithelial sodium channel/degenerin-like protein n=1 Tax=Polyphagotarsonemus latus TaxID=1204166 RepID=A0AAN0LW06_9ACAR
MNFKNKVLNDKIESTQQYLNKRLPWYCETTSPVQWFKQFSNDQFPKVKYKINQNFNKTDSSIEIEKNDNKNDTESNSSITYVKKSNQDLDTIENLKNSNNLSIIIENQLNRFSKNQIDKNEFDKKEIEKNENLRKFSNSSYNQEPWRKFNYPGFRNINFKGSSLSSFKKSSIKKNFFKLKPFVTNFRQRSSSFINLKDMFADSSVPGVREICNSNNNFRKIIWLITFVLFSFLALNAIQQLLSDFYSYPITVDMRMRESRKLAFPAVTICNLNIVRYSALCNSTLNVSMPIELQEKLCGISLSTSKNTSIEDINDILPDSDQGIKTTTLDDYFNYEDEVGNDSTTAKQDSSTHVNRKHKQKFSSKKTNFTDESTTTYKPKITKKTRFKRSPTSNTNTKSHGATGTVSNPNSNINKVTSFPSDTSTEVEMIELTEREEKELQENLTTWLAVMANKNKNLTFFLGHQFDDMILRCTIKSTNCTHPNSFVSSFTPTEGNCYTFIAKTNTNPSPSHTTFKPTTPMSTVTQSTFETSDSFTGTSESPKINPPLQVELFSTTEPPDLSTKTERTTEKKIITTYNEPEHNQVETILAGADHGLELVINLEKNEYLPGTAQIGALVMVHSPDDFGISASEAIMVSPGCATYIGLKMVKISRLPAPYPEQCVDIWPKGLQRKSMLNASYSQQACIKICLQKTIFKRCKCQSAFLEQFEFNGTELRICDTRKRNTRRCVEEVMLRPENKLEDCKCPPRCQVIQYEKTVSLARWPTREDRVSFDRGTKDISISNVAKVVVYYQTMTLQEVTQQAAWTSAKLLSSIGGFMGMYVGFSFLSLFELFEIFFRRIWFLMSRKRPSFKIIAKIIQALIRTRNAAKKNHQNVA